VTWRVVVTGSECTGKTTLAQAIALRLGAPYVAEPSRAYAEARGGVLSAADVEPIALATIAALDQGKGAGVVICDTDLVSTVVYARAYYGSCPAWIEAECRDHLGDLYLLCTPDIPWVADGVRDRPLASERTAMHEAFALTLRDLGARTVLIEGTGTARTDRALAAVNAALPSTAERA
jgi:NadR type nicotinamide-nucleotide adenylyltransferase